jgi:hypothetical protein
MLVFLQVFKLATTQQVSYEVSPLVGKARGRARGRGTGTSPPQVGVNGGFQVRKAMFSAVLISLVT